MLRNIATVAALMLGLSACGLDIRIEFGTAKIRDCRVRGENLDPFIHVELTDPYQCRYTIYDYEEILPVAVEYRNDDAWYENHGVAHQVVNAFGEADNPITIVRWVAGGGCFPSPVCQLYEGAFVAGTADVGTVDVDFRDFYRASGEKHVVLGTPTQWVEIELRGVLGEMADIYGPTSVQAGQAQTFSAVVVGDTGSYQYKWYTNGNLSQNGGARISWSPGGESGTYTLTSIATLMDQTKDTVTKSIEVVMGAAPSGPTELEAGQNGTWQAIGYGARNPLSCVWYVNWSYAASGSCTFDYSFSTPLTTNDISVDVTDARGVTASGYASVFIRTPGCWPPECYEQMRIPADSSKQPKRPAKAIR